MRLTKQTDFALRALIYLAKKPAGKRVFAQDIAKNYGVPLNHLTKIINKLSRLGYVKTYRGRNGGIELGKAREEIFIRQIIVDFEPFLNPADCDSCLLSEHCALKDCLNQASEAFLQVLGDKNLADIAISSTRKEEALGAAQKTEKNHNAEK